MGDKNLDRGQLDVLARRYLIESTKPVNKELNTSVCRIDFDRRALLLGAVKNLFLCNKPIENAGYTLNDHKAEINRMSLVELAFNLMYRSKVVENLDYYSFNRSIGMAIDYVDSLGHRPYAVGTYNVINRNVVVAENVQYAGTPGILPEVMYTVDAPNITDIKGRKSIKSPDEPQQVLDYIKEQLGLYITADLCQRAGISVEKLMVGGGKVDIKLGKGIVLTQDQKTILTIIDKRIEEVSSFIDTLEPPQIKATSKSKKTVKKPSEPEKLQGKTIISIPEEYAPTIEPPIEEEKESLDVLFKIDPALIKPTNLEDAKGTPLGIGPDGNYCYPNGDRYTGTTYDTFSRGVVDDGKLVYGDPGIEEDYEPPVFDDDGHMIAENGQAITLENGYTDDDVETTKKQETKQKDGEPVQMTLADFGVQLP